MQLLVIPGYSISNKDWAEETAKKTNGKVHYWEHWQKGKFNPQEEAEKIVSEAGEDPTNIIAKSIGTYVLMLALDKIKIGKLILCGICINDLDGEELKSFEVLRNFDSSKIMVFQNSDDKHGSFKEVTAFLSKINPNIKIIEKPGNTHEYPYYGEFKKFLS